MNDTTIRIAGKKIKLFKWVLYHLTSHPLLLPIHFGTEEL